MEFDYPSLWLDNFGIARDGAGADLSGTVELDSSASATASTGDGHDGTALSSDNNCSAHGLDESSATDDPRAGLESAFRRAFAVVDESLPNRQWAREFLLDQSPQAAAQMLTNPATLPHGVWASQADMLFDTDGGHSGMFNAYDRYESMYVPAFSAGALTVGVFMSRSAPTHRKDLNELPPCQWQFAPEAEPRSRLSPVFSQMASPSKNSQLGVAASRLFSIGRYVLDAASGRILVVSHHKSLARDIPTSTHVFYIYSQSTTRSERIRLTCDGALFAAGALLDSVRYCATKNESRFCPICGTPPGRNDCACKLPMRKSAHPFDFSGDVLAMTRYLGEFLGTSSVISAASSGPCAPSSPSSLGRAFLTASMLVSSTRIDGFCAKDPRHIDLTALFQAFAVQVSTSDMSPGLSVMPGAAQTASATSLPYCQDPVINRSEVLSISAPHLEQCAGLSCNVHAENLTNDSNSLNATLGAEVVDETVDLPAESDHSVNVSVALVDSPGNAYAGLPCGASIIVSNSRPGSRDQEGDLLPDSTVVREARRRLKNREAAARSNARRRERNAALKNELSEAVRKASELRRIEAMLRSENIALRRRFGSFLLKE
jgi:hypothetical protein